MEYDKETGQTVNATTEVPADTGFAGGVDPTALDVLSLAQGAKFAAPFTVTLMRRAGSHVHRTDAGTRQEAAFEVHKETIREPADLLKINAGLVSGAYKLLNNNTIELQLLLYIASTTGVLKKD